MKNIFSAVALCALFVAPAFAADAPQIPEKAAAAAQPKGPTGVSHNPLITNAPLPGDFVQGKKTAPVTIVEYASLSCPHCAHFSETVLPVIEKNYIDTGKVRYVLRQFPLNEPALKGAMLLNCVGKTDQARYFTFAKVLFDAQSKWAFDGNWQSGLETIAAVGGVSKDQFAKCISDSDGEVKVLKDKKTAIDSLNIPYTPFFFIDNEVYEGDKTPEAMSAFIDAHLAKKK